MTSQERVLTAVNGEPPDRIPIDFWAAGEVLERLISHLGVEDAEAVRKHFDVDLRVFRGPGFSGGEADENGLFTDHWGVKRKTHTVTGRRKDGTDYIWTSKHLAESPLAGAQSIADIEQHPWPDASALDYSGVGEACRTIHDAGYAVVFGGDRLDRTAQLKAGMYLRGMEQFVMDLALEPELAECMLEHIAAYYLDYNRRVFEVADGMIDIFFMGDDMGTQNSTWVSTDMYRQFFKQRFTRFNELAHDFDIKTMYHTCGCVSDLVGEFADAGLDILQSMQPGSMRDDFQRLKREYGANLCFQGGIDIQHILPTGSTDDVRRHVKETARVLGDGGGYIFGTAHNILPDTPTDNIMALIDAYHEFGQY
ncbi:MAG: hypothetical protein KAH24_00635 [Holophagae bacterium]|nr:hypothetical protein [Holophagae bacterium]